LAATSASDEMILYLPRDVARILKCSEWWVKEQARKRRIPFCWIGGGYRFTPDHLAEIVRVFERKTADAEVVSMQTHRARRSGTARQPTNESAQLTARIPRRARKAKDTGHQDAA
jgi:hypothetical protein